VSESGTLSEAASKALLQTYGVPIADEREVSDAPAAVQAADALGYPVVVKLCGAAIAHKTERGLVRLRLGDAESVRVAAAELLAEATAADGDVSLLVAPMVSGNRELIAGVVRDPQFGANVMLGVGGIVAEAIADVQFRSAPISEIDAQDMINSLSTQKLLEPFRGEPAVDRERLTAVLMGLSALATARPDVVAVDVNPLIVRADGTPVAVDALVEIGDGRSAAAATRRRPTNEQFEALFDPKGVLVAGASTHPGKFGFVSLHNILASGYKGRVFGTNLDGEEVLGIRTVADIADLPDDAIDLVFVCTPAAANESVLRSCAAKGVKAAFLTSAGYGEAGEAGRVAEAQLVALADELGILLAGPNGQGLVSTPQTCAPRSWRRTRPAAASLSRVRAATWSAVS
jgi:acyl-CoA synthetase (NDP forming)